MKRILPIVLALLAVLTVAWAQDNAFTGTVTLRNGQTLSGIIKSADLGIMDGAGIGTNLAGNGAFRVTVDGQTQRITADKIALVEVKWQDKSTPEEPRWEITELKITTTDGKVIVGKPAWYMHATNVSVQLPSGETKRVHAFPLAGPDFSADNLIAKIEIGKAVTPTVETPATPATPAAPTTPATPAVETPATPTTPTTPATPATPTSPATPAVETPAAPATPATPATPAVAAPPAVASPGTPVTVVVPIPGTDKKVTVLIYVTVVDGEVKVVPAAP